MRPMVRLVPILINESLSQLVLLIVDFSNSFQHLTNPEN